MAGGGAGARLNAAPARAAASNAPGILISRKIVAMFLATGKKVDAHGMAGEVKRRAAGGETRACVDTAPVMEKELAARAGIGWLGKNSCIINEGMGSWLLLGEILTTLELPFDDPAIDRCGTCRRCIDACPTNAIT